MTGLAFHEDSETVTGTISLGSLHGVSCKAIALDRADLTKKPSCSDPSFSFKVAKGELNHTLSIGGTVTYAEGISHGITAGSVKAQVGVAKPSGLKVTLDGATCHYSWTLSGGKTGDVTVTGATKGSGNTATATVKEWQTCPSITVTNTYAGASAHESGPSNRPTRKVKPTVDASKFDVRWGGQHGQVTLTVSDSSGAINAYGQTPTVTVTIAGAAHTWSGYPHELTVDVGDIADDATWQLTAQIGDDTAYRSDATAARAISGHRAAQERAATPGQSNGDDRKSTAPSAFRAASSVFPARAAALASLTPFSEGA
ncbi:MAG: hypothetical protein UHD09_09625 [Bifidobacterium sp.]|nr:hypothetical protein [Bifidobacterium sp.]